MSKELEILCQVLDTASFFTITPEFRGEKRLAAIKSGMFRAAQKIFDILRLGGDLTADPPNYMNR